MKKRSASSIDIKGDCPLEGYEEWALEVVDYASGLPLTIKVLGSHLCGQVESVWIDVLERLKMIPLKQTLDILELSYNSLEDEHKEIFLHVACFLKGWTEEHAIRNLESCGFRAIYGLTVLEQKNLITFSPSPYPYYDDLFIDMHDHIQEMGQNIVRRKHPDEPNKHSRLWIDKEIEDILVNDLGTEATRCINLGFTSLHPEIIMKGLRSMKKLKYLQLHTDILPINLKFDEAIQYFPNALQYLDWSCYPFCSLPRKFQANNLVALQMFESKIEQLWEGGERKVLGNLRFLNLSHSKLTKLDLGLTPNLEVLILKKCDDLLELDMSVGCSKLKSVNLSDSKVPKLNLGLTPNLEVLKLKECNHLSELHMSVGCRKLRYLKINGSKLVKLDIGLTPNFEVVKVKHCDDLLELHMSVGCPSLRSLDLSDLKLTKLDLRKSSNLEILYLDSCCDLIELKMPIESLKLRSLYFNLLELEMLDLGMTKC